MPRSSRVSGLLLLLAATSLGAAASCGRFHRSPDDPPDAYLLFSNESLYQADVFIVVPGTEARRVGTVMGGRTDTLTVPRDMTMRAGSLSIVARIFARSAAPSSGPLTISPGEVLRVTLPSNEKLLTVLPGP